MLSGVAEAGLVFWCAATAQVAGLATWQVPRLPEQFMSVALGASRDQVAGRLRSCQSLAADRQLCVLSDTSQVLLVNDSVASVYYEPAAIRPQIRAEAAWEHWRRWARRVFGSPDSVRVRPLPAGVEAGGRTLTAYWRSSARPSVTAVLTIHEVSTVVQGPRPDAYTKVVVALTCMPAGRCATR
jgi:hypothetical protein